MAPTQPALPGLSALELVRVAGRWRTRASGAGKGGEKRAIRRSRALDCKPGKRASVVSAIRLDSRQTDRPT